MNTTFLKALTFHAYIHVKVYIHACHSKIIYGKFENKCISRHQIPVVKIHLIESEITQNKEQLFNCT